MTMAISSYMKYLLVYILPMLIIGLSYIGQHNDIANIIVFLPIVLLYIAPPMINSHLKPADVAPQESSSRSRLYFRCVTWVCIPLQFLMLWVSLNLFSLEILNSFGVVGWLLSTGLFSALFAINVAHELIHRPSKFDRFLGGVLLSSVFFGVFKIVHLRVHHRYVGTPEDFASSKRYQNIYAYWWQAIKGNFFEGFRYDLLDMRNSRKNIFQSEFFLWYGISMIWLVFVFFSWGFEGCLFLFAVSFVAILKLELINYLQHYGLSRKKLSSGNYEAVCEKHAWSQNSDFTNAVLLNLMRHSDHHTNPRLPYEAMRNNHVEPRYPYDFSVMCILALVPKVFFKVADKQLDLISSRQNIVGRVI